MEAPPLRDAAGDRDRTKPIADKLEAFVRRRGARGVQYTRVMRRSLGLGKHKNDADQAYRAIIARLQSEETRTRKSAAPISEAPATMQLEQSPVIEINNTCNIDCLMCKTSLSTRKKGKISDDTLESVLESLEPYEFAGVELHTIGDPLANPNLRGVLGKLRQRGIRTALTTNGLLLKRHIDTILDHLDVVNGISFSIDGATRETYERIRFGGKWDDLLESLEIARTRLRPVLPVRISMTVSLDNVSEVGAFIERFRDVVQIPGLDLAFSLLNSLSPDTSYFETYNLFPEHTRPNLGCSFVGGGSLFFHINSDVSVCCRDYDGSLVIGNVAETPLPEIQNSDALRRLQSAHASGDVSEFPLCNNCNVIDHEIDALVAAAMKYTLIAYPEKDGAFYQACFDALVHDIKHNVCEPDIEAVITRATRDDGPAN